MRDSIDSDDGFNESPGSSWNESQNEWSIIVNESVKMAVAIFEPQKLVKSVQENFVDSSFLGEKNERPVLVGKIHDWSKSNHLFNFLSKIWVHGVGNPELCGALRVAHVRNL